MDRRKALQTGLLISSVRAFENGAAWGGVPTRSGAGSSSLPEKAFGCIAGCHIGSAMGAAVEGWSWERIEKTHGTLDRLLPYEYNGWIWPPGTTEDGVERQKLMITAIIDKQDHVTAEDVRAIWVRDIKPPALRTISTPFEGDLLAIAKSPVPASDIGKYCDYSGLVALGRSCHPLGLINAGDVEGAVRDVREVGQLYHTAGSRGIRWAEVTVAAIAAAARPRATVDSVLGAVFDHCDETLGPFQKSAGVPAELERGLKLTANCADFRDMRQRFDTVYSGGIGIAYAGSFANEVITKAVCIFKMAKGNTWEAIKASVNMGRDTDCAAAVAAGISGSLSGAGSIPQELVEQVDAATSKNEHTNSRRTLRETSDGLFVAYQKRLGKMKALAQEMAV